MIDEKELKDSVKECVDIAMEQNDEAKREIFAGLFEEVDRLINETITIQAINDDEKKKWFDNEMIKTYEQEIKELQEENKMQDRELERLRNIIKEVRELRKKISNCYYEDGFELDTPMLLEYIDGILDKENK